MEIKFSTGLVVKNESNDENKFEKSVFVSSEVLELAPMPPNPLFKGDFRNPAIQA